MPAYFNMSLQFLRDDIYGMFVSDFYSVLDHAGLKFKSGYWGFEEECYADIIEWNQKKLEQNFHLGYTQHYKHDYKQVLYDFDGFLSVRGFWMNNYPEDNTFSYEIIIPEDEVLCSEYPARFKKEKMIHLLEAARKIWQFPLVRTIQTGLEGNDASIGLTKLASGYSPNVQPFAIIEGRGNCPENLDFRLEKVPGREGICYFLREGEGGIQ